MLIDEGLLHFVLRAEAMLELISGPQIAQLSLHHGPQVSRGVVMKLENLTEVAVPEDDHPSTEIIGLHEVVNPFR
jgi:hypothetical protein